MIEALALVNDRGLGIFFINERLLFANTPDKNKQISSIEIKLKEKGFYINSLLKLPRNFDKKSTPPLIMMFVSKTNFSQIYIEELITDKSIEKIANKSKNAEISKSLIYKTDFRNFSNSNFHKACERIGCFLGSNYFRRHCFITFFK